jgi:hypothetical protein
MKAMKNYFKVLALGLALTLGLASTVEVSANTINDLEYTFEKDGSNHGIVFFTSTDDGAGKTDEHKEEEKVEEQSVEQTHVEEGQHEPEDHSARCSSSCSCFC